MILITDRTLVDVINDAEKGNYDYTDRNRVGSAISEIATLLREFDYIVPVSPKTDWNEDDYPTVSLMAAYLEDVETLCAIYNSIPSHGTLKTLPENLRFMDFNIANNIEKNLLAINDLAATLVRSFDCCNEIYAGE